MKLQTGCIFEGLAKYLVRAGKSPEEQALVKVVDTNEVHFEMDDDYNMYVNPRTVAIDFDAQVRAYTGNREIRKPVYHWSLSYSPKDNVSDEQMLADAKDFLNRVGFANTQYIISVHKDKKHLHTHIESNIVDNEGKRISTFRLIDRAHEAAAAITRERGYTWGETTKKEDITQEKIHDPHDRVRKMIKPVVKEALAASTSLDEFVEKLKKAGISCRYTEAADGKRGRISYSYKYESRDHDFKGSSLARELSFFYVKQQLDRNYVLDVHDRMFKVCHDLYESKRAVWQRVAEDREEIWRKYARIADLKAYNEDLKRRIYESKTSSELMSLIALLLLFINPFAALALMVVDECTANADLNEDVARRQAVRNEMANIFAEIEFLKNEQAVLKSRAKELLVEYKENAEQRKIFDEKYKAVKAHLAMPVKEEEEKKQEKPQAALKSSPVIINQTQTKSRPVSPSPASPVISVKAEDIIERKPEPNKPATRPEPTPVNMPVKTVAAEKPAVSEEQPANVSVSTSGPVPSSEEDKQPDLIEILKQKFPFRDAGHMQYIIDSTTDASIFFYGNEKDSKYANFPTEEHYRNGEPKTIDKYEEARDMLKRKVYSVFRIQNSSAFYNALVRKQKNGNFRVGDILIHPDGKISFGQERIFGDPKLTASIIPLKSEAQNKEVVKEDIKVSTVSTQTSQKQQSQNSVKDNVVWHREVGERKSRIILRDDGKYELQSYNSFSNSWNKKTAFRSYKELGGDKNYAFLRITHSNGHIEHLNQYGEPLTPQQKRSLGLLGMRR